MTKALNNAVNLIQVADFISRNFRLIAETSKSGA